MARSGGPDDLLHRDDAGTGGRQGPRGGDRIGVGGPDVLRRHRQVGAPPATDAGMQLRDEHPGPDHGRDEHRGDAPTRRAGSPRRHPARPAAPGSRAGSWSRQRPPRPRTGWPRRTRHRPRSAARPRQCRGHAATAGAGGRGRLISCPVVRRDRRRCRRPVRLRSVAGALFPGSPCGDVREVGRVACRLASHHSAGSVPRR